MKKYLLKKLIVTLTLMITSSCAGITAVTPTTDETNPNTVSATIAADGGSITSSDGMMTLSIPAGALDEDTEISITPVETDVGTVYEFQPDGLVFNVPATATVETPRPDMSASLDETGSTDADGNPIDPAELTPSAMLFLINDDGTAEMLETSTVESEEGSDTLTVTTQIPHFTSMLSVTGNSFYVYMTSLGTHYVGSDFKSDVSIRYLGYSATSSYKNMSIEYEVRNITVNQIKFDVTGAIKIVSPNPINRSDTLNTRGQESATRPKFNCDSVGDGTVKVTVDVTGIVKVTFQPENKTRVFTVSHTETTTRKGKCIARVSQNDYYNDGGASEEVQVAMGDPTGDVLVDYNNEGTLVPALEVGMDFPGTVDTELVSLSLVGGTNLSVTLNVGGTIPTANPDDVLFSSFDLLILDPSVGDTGFAPFQDALWDLSMDASGAGTSLSPSVYHWNGDALVDRADISLEGSVNDQSITLNIPLEDLGLTAEEAQAANFRAVTQMTMSSGDFFVDVAEFGFNNI